MRGLLLSMLMLPVGLFADTVIVTGGSTYNGSIVKITPEAVVLESGRQRSVIARSEVISVVFTRSDLLVTIAGDTLIGKILRGEGDPILVGMEGGLREFRKGELKATLRMAGASVTLREVSDTDGSFANPLPAAKRTKSPFSISLFAGTHPLAYLYPGDVYFREAPFEKELSGSVYGFEFGHDLGRSVSASIGLFWSTVPTGIAEGPGPLKPKRVGYAGGFLSTLYRFFPDSSLDMVVRIRLAILRGRSEVLSQSTEAGELTGMVIPAIEVGYAFTAAFRCYVGVEYQSATLPLDRTGASVRLRGFLLSGGIQFRPLFSE